MKRRILVLVVYLGVLTALVLVAQRYLSLEELVEQEDRLRATLDEHWWVGVAIGFLVYLGLSLVPGTAGKSLIVGWLYGFWTALVVVNVGLTIAGTLTFWVSHFVFHDAIQSRFALHIERLNRAIEERGAYHLFVARLLHAPFSMTNYLMAATRLRTRSFWWATQLGLLPGNICFVYAGTQLPTLQELVEHGVSSLLTPGLLAVLVILSVLPFFLRYSVRRYRRWQARRERATGSSAPRPE